MRAEHADTGVGHRLGRGKSSHLSHRLQAYSPILRPVSLSHVSAPLGRGRPVKKWKLSGSCFFIYPKEFQNSNKTQSTQANFFRGLNLPLLRLSTAMTRSPRGRAVLERDPSRGFGKPPHEYLVI